MIPETGLKKDGKPRNQVPGEGFKREEGWHEILNIWLNFVKLSFCGLNNTRKLMEI